MLVNPELRDIRVPVPEFLRYVGALVLLKVGLLISWTIVAPPYYRPVIYPQDADGMERWNGACELLPPGTLPFALSLLFVHLIVIQFGIYLCYRSRGVSQVYTEGQSIGFILWQDVQMTIIGVMVGALVYPFSSEARGSSALVFAVVKWLAPMSVNATVVALLFVPKMLGWCMQQGARGTRSLPTLPQAYAPACKPTCSSIVAPFEAADEPRRGPSSPATLRAGTQFAS